MTRFARKTCAAAQLHPARLTPKAEIQELIKSLRPVDCGNDLIRLGPNGDGGYLVPDDLDGITACFSPGVSKVSGFELSCAERGMKVYLADNSVEKPSNDHDQFHFTKKHLASYADEVFMTLGHWVSSTVGDTEDDLLLQMDIEGAEYEVFFNTPPELMKRFRVMVIEFHTLEQWWNLPYFRTVKRVFEKILLTHTCVHNHPNNACSDYKKSGLVIPLATELTFIRNDRVNHRGYRTEFPHPLDCDNSNKKPPISLNRYWYKD